MPGATWKTGISHVEPNKILIRGYDMHEIMGRLSFGEAVYLLWVGEIPAPPIGRLINAILISSMDHGATPPSVLAARTVASCGAPLGSAIAAGVLALSKYHGAAIEDCRSMIDRVLARMGQGQPLEGACDTELDALAGRGERASGLGHRLHTQDPRVEYLFELCAACGTSGQQISALRGVAAALGRRGKMLPINVDGAIAACLGEIDFPLTLSNALFILARSAGIAVQAHEEQARERPMRPIDPGAYEYDGIGERRLHRPT
jgi:citrate synthase